MLLLPLWKFWESPSPVAEPGKSVRCSAPVRPLRSAEGMAQRNRYVGPGTWHHVYNRGIDKRIILASRADYRLHELAGMRCEQVARAMGVSNGTISRWIRVHRRCMNERDRYARTAAAVARLAIRRTHRRG